MVPPEGHPPDSSVGDSKPDLSGAYDLSFVLLTEQQVRIYLVRKGTDRYAAQVETASPLTVTVSSEALTIVGWTRSETVGRRRSPGYATATGSKLVLRRSPTGELSDEATVEVSMPGPDAEARAATLVRAHTPVSLQVTGASGTPPRLTLPWTPVVVTFGSGIAVSPLEFEQQIRVTTAAGETLHPGWLYPPKSSGNADVGAVRAQAYFDWDQVAGQTVQFELPAGFADATGVAPLADSVQTSIDIAKFGQAVRSHEFEDDRVADQFQGPVAFERESAACQGACVRLGPLAQSCNRAAVVGVIENTASVSRVLLRARLATTVKLSSLTMFVSLYGEGGGGSGAIRPVSDDGSVDLGEAVGPFRYTSEWQTVMMALSGPWPRIGFEIAIESECNEATLPGASSQSVLLIDRIAAQ